jgi:hypothetical protein
LFILFGFYLKVLLQIILIHDDYFHTAWRVLI